MGNSKISSFHKILFISLSALTAFLVGFTQLLLNSIPASLFLTSFSPTYLPLAYICGAAVILSMGFAQNFLEEKVGSNRFLFLLGITFLLFTLCIICGFEIYKVVWLIFLFQVFGLIGPDLFDLVLWGLFNQLYTIDQVKKLFGPLGVFQSGACITAGFVMPIILTYIHIQIAAYLIIVLGLVSLALIALLFTMKGKSIVFSEVCSHSFVKKKSSKLPFKDSYVRTNLLYSFFGLIIYMSLDMSMLNLSRQIFPSPDKLAAFLSLSFTVVLMQ